MNSSLSFSLVLGLAFLHAFAAKLPILDRLSPKIWVSGAGGAAISYVFLDVFPALSKIQERIEGTEFVLPFTKPIYVIALVGLIFFHGLDRFADRLAMPGQKYNPYFFWIHIGSFTVNNIVLGYLLQDSSRHTNFLECLVLFIAIGLHFLVIDRNLRLHHSFNYDRIGRWMLVGGIMAGATIRLSSEVNELLVLIMWSLMSGSVILNVLREEITNEKNSSFIVFAISAIGYGLLLIYGLPE